MEGETAVFHTRSGVLKASKVSGYREYKEDPDEEENEEQASERTKPSDMGVVELDFPSTPPTACDDTDLLSQALGGVKVKWVGTSSSGDYLVQALYLTLHNYVVACPSLQVFTLLLTLVHVHFAQVRQGV